MNCDAGIKGAWALFDPFEGSQAIAHTHKKYTFHNTVDKPIINSMREWLAKYFDNNELTGIPLSEAVSGKKQDFDLLGYVLDVKKKDKFDRVLICDKKKVMKLDVATGRNSYISPQEVVRVRSANYVHGGKMNKLTLNEYSNILRAPKQFRSSKKLMKAI